jgi:DNA-binding GntR family transcriptional regulator
MTADVSKGERPLGRLPPSTTRADQVYEILREAIADGSLVPGSLHTAQSIADRLDVSRTPVREALLQLGREGMVTQQRNRGVQVRENSPHDLEEIFHLRLLLEVPATALAVKRDGAGLVKRARRAFEAMHAGAIAGDEQRLWRHDRAFHAEILNASGNLRLAAIVDGLRAQLLLGDWTTVARQARSLVEIADEHRPILTAIEQLDDGAAAARMGEHITHTADLMLARDRDRATSNGVAPPTSVRPTAWTPGNE